MGTLRLRSAHGMGGDENYAVTIQGGNTNEPPLLIVHKHSRPKSISERKDTGKAVQGCGSPEEDRAVVQGTWQP